MTSLMKSLFFGYLKTSHTYCDSKTNGFTLRIFSYCLWLGFLYTYHFGEGPSNFHLMTLPYREFSAVSG